MPAPRKPAPRKPAPRKTAPTKAPAGDSAAVDAYMRALKHPLKDLMEEVRATVLAASPKIQERIKWNAPSFFYGKDMAAFHPRNTVSVQMVFVFHDGAMLEDDSGLLEGDYVDRRMAYFHSATDLRAKKAALQRVVRAWVKLIQG